MRQDLADDVGKLILRLTLGILFLLHGIAKLRGGVGGIQGMLEAQGLPAILAYGAYLGEVLGPALLLLGWYARVGAGLITVNMVFAIGLASRDQLLQLNEFGGWALELEGMFLFTAIALIFTGPGRFGINER